MSIVRLRGEDAVELYELLEFVTGWIDADAVRLRACLHELTGSRYTLEELQADLARFILLLGDSHHRLAGGGAQ